VAVPAPKGERTLIELAQELDAHLHEIMTKWIAVVHGLAVLRVNILLTGEGYLFRSSQLWSPGMELFPNMRLLQQLSWQTSKEGRRGTVWKMTPFAWSACCMIPIGGGRYLGDEMYEHPGEVRLLGSRVEIISGFPKAACKIALVDEAAPRGKSRRK
jgi:hypothetical protein